MFLEAPPFYMTTSQESIHNSTTASTTSSAVQDAYNSFPWKIPSGMRFLLSLLVTCPLAAGLLHLLFRFLFVSPGS